MSPPAARGSGLEIEPAPSYWRHQATAAGDTARVREIETEIDRLAARLWGLTAAELKEIQESLQELQ